MTQVRPAMGSGRVCGSTQIVLRGRTGNIRWRCWLEWSWRAGCFQKLHSISAAGSAAAAVAATSSRGGKSHFLRPSFAASFVTAAGQGVFFICLGLCVCMTSLLGVEIWSQNIGDSTVSIPWLVMPILLKFQKSQKNNEA